MIELLYVMQCESGVYRVNSQDLANFCAEVYGMGVVPDVVLESDADMIHSYNVFRGPLEDPMAVNDLISWGELQYWRLGEVLIDLVNRDLIPEGTWEVEVIW